MMNSVMHHPLFQWNTYHPLGLQTRRMITMGIEYCREVAEDPWIAYLVSVKLYGSRFLRRIVNHLWCEVRL